jgi:hypothetical protein
MGHLCALNRITGRNFMPANDQPPSSVADAPPREGDDRTAIERLRLLDIDVKQLAAQPLPQGLWTVIEVVVRPIRGKSTRWYAAASLYGRFVSVLKAGGTAGELVEQFAAGPALARLMAHAQLREMVLAAGLPGTLNRWLAEVVGRTRLRPSEKIAVAVDLIDQFHESLSAGQTAAAIVQALGNSEVVGRRLRREKIRQRPWWWHALRWTGRSVAALFIVFATAAGCLLYRFHSVAAVTPADEIERLDAIASAIPVEDRAWPLYCAGFDKLELEPRTDTQSWQKWSEILDACTTGPAHAAWPEASVFLGKNRESVELFLQGSVKPHLGFVRRDARNEGWLRKIQHGNVAQTFARPADKWAFLLPEASAFPYLKAAFLGTAHEAAAGGDWPRAVRCLTATARLARQVWDEEQFAIMRINSLVILDSAADGLANMLAEHGESTGEYELQQAIDALQSWTPDWQNELRSAMRQQQRDFFSDMYSADGRFTKRGLQIVCATGRSQAQEAQWFRELFQMKPGEVELSKALRFQVLGPCIVPLVAERDELLQEWDLLSQLHDAERKDKLPSEPVAGPYERELDRLDERKRLQLRYLPIVLQGRETWPATAVEGRWTKSTGREAVLIVIAAELYRRRYGSWPLSSKSLSPEFLRTVPLDPYDGQPLRLRVVDGRLAVYSVGLNKRDDTVERAPAKNDEIDEGDWPLYPPIRPKPDVGEGN